MKTYIVIIQTSANNFQYLVLDAKIKNELYPMYRNLGMTVSTQEYSTHNLKMAQMQVNQYNNI